VALAPVTARAPEQDLDAKTVAREARPLDQLERLVEERASRCDAGQLVAADPEPEQDVGPLDVAEARALDDPPRLEQQVDRLLELSELVPRPGETREPAKHEIRRSELP